jgi:hypothetical protein
MVSMKGFKVGDTVAYQSQRGADPFIGQVQEIISLGLDYDYLKIHSQNDFVLVLEKDCTKLTQEG